jgi:hypothetical protein
MTDAMVDAMADSPWLRPHETEDGPMRAEKRRCWAVAIEAESAAATAVGLAVGQLIAGIQGYSVAVEERRERSSSPVPQVWLR